MTKSQKFSPLVPEIPLIKLQTLVFLVVALVTLGAVNQAWCQDGVIGPGIAGQIHSLAFDPDDPNTIYAGGDTPGAFVSHDYGDTWEYFNNGFENNDLTRASYVDDILVLRSGDQNYQGIYAATHAGIYYRGFMDDRWELQTDYQIDDRFWFIYQGDPEQEYDVIDLPTPLAFSSLAYDATNEVLYAGAGHSRGGTMVSTFEPYFYPTHGGSPAYSLWRCDIGRRGDGIWEPVTVTDEKGMVRQVAVVQQDGKSLIAFASTEGLFAYNPKTKKCTTLWVTADKSSGGGPGSNEDLFDFAWAVAGGKNGHIYCSAKLDGDDFLRVYWRDLNEEESGWNLLGDPDQEVYPHVDEDAWTWGEIIQTPNCFMKTMSVVPGDETNEDQIYVGQRHLTMSSGHFRYGSYQDESGVPTTGWLHIHYLEGDWNYFTYNALNWWSGPVTKQENIEIGWCDNSSIGSTTAIAFHPTVPSKMIVQNYHLPMVRMETGWEQKNCTQESDIDPDYWATTGLTLMGTTSLNFTSDGRAILGCGDWTAFLEDTTGGEHFKWMDPWNMGRKQANDIEILEAGESGEEDTILMLRGAPRAYVDSQNWDLCFFGFANDGVLGYQEFVVAQYAPELSDAAEYPDGYGWRFLSRGIDDIIEAETGLATYQLTDMEIIDESTMFVTVSKKIEPGLFESWVFRGERLGDYEWDWQIWRSFGQDYSAIKMVVLPGTTRLLVAAGGADAGIFCLDTEDPDYMVPWLSKSTLNSSDPYNDPMWLSLTFLTNLTCSKGGETVYACSRGEYFYLPGGTHNGTVLRLDVPISGDPAPTDWVMLANGEGENTFGFVTPFFWVISSDYNFGDVDSSHRLTSFLEVAVDPANPHKIYAGMRNGGTNSRRPFQHNNGVWCYAPDSAGSGTWSQFFGANNANRGARQIAFSPSDPGLIYIGIGDQAFFKRSVPLSPAPTIAGSALHPICQGTGVNTLLAVSGEAHDGGPLGHVEVDATAIGGSERLALNDSGEAGDLVASDGVWSVTLVDVAADLGVTVLPVTTRDLAWNTCYGTLEVTVVAQPTFFEIHGNLDYQENGFFTYIFTWETDLWTWPQQDLVVFDLAGTAVECQLTEPVLYPGAEYGIVPLENGHFYHELTLSGQDCLPGCIILFQVESGLGSVVATSTPVSMIKTILCPISGD